MRDCPEHLFWPAQVRAAEDMARKGLPGSLVVGCYLCGESVDLAAEARLRISLRRPRRTRWPT